MNEKTRLRNERRVGPKRKAPSTAYKPGQSGNPGGRSRGPNFSTVLRELITKKKKFRKPDGTLFEATELELIVKRAIKELRKGRVFDVRLFEALMNRMDGKPAESLTLEGGISIERTTGEMSDEELVTIAAGYQHSHRN